MPDMKAALTKKIGPLPAWGWGLVVGGGYVGYRLISGGGLSLPAASATDNTADTSGITAGGGSGTGSDPSGSYGSGQQSSLLDAYVAGEDAAKLGIVQVPPPAAVVTPVVPATPVNPYWPGMPYGWHPPVMPERPKPTPIAGELPKPTPQPGNPPTKEVVSLKAALKKANAGKRGWKIWGAHWKDVAKHRTTTSAGRKNTAAYKAGRARLAALNAQKTKRTGTAATGYVKPKPVKKPPPHKKVTKPKVIRSIGSVKPGSKIRPKK